MIIEFFGLMLTPLWYEKQDSRGIVIISVTAGQYKDLLEDYGCAFVCINVCNIIVAAT